MVRSIDLMLEKHQVDCRDKVVVILGKSYLVGCPTRMLFHRKGATVLLCDQFTENLEKLIKMADILVLGTGQEIKLGKDSIKENSIVFDIGIRMKETGQGLQVCGDIETQEAS